MEAMVWVMTTLRTKTSTIREEATITSDERQSENKNQPSHPIGS